jgi:hypothetical protein
MRIIPTWLHGVLDYPLGVLLIALPWLGGFATGGAAMWIPIAAGRHAWSGRAHGIRSWRLAHDPNVGALDG